MQGKQLWKLEAELGKTELANKQIENKIFTLRETQVIIGRGLQKCAWWKQKF